MSEKKHICIVVDCLSGGGAEKVAASLSFLLKENFYRVSIISLRDQITYAYAGKLYNLGIDEPSIKQFKQLKKIYSFRKYYKRINADYYIDFRMRNRFLMEFILHFFVFDVKKTIMGIHHYNINYHLPKGKLFKKEYSKVKAIIAVSKAIEDKLNSYHEFKNVHYIPNFVNIESMSGTNINIKVPESFVLAIGRLNNFVKQFDKLILSYSKTKTFKAGVSLIILGDGPDKLKLERLIKSLNLQSSIKLLGFVPNPYDYIKRCKFLVLCSKYEGMPLVILETLALGKPVISFDCKSGPSELLIHNVNGLLVMDQNFCELEKNIDILQHDGALYKTLTNNTVKSISRFSKRKIMKNWKKIFYEEN